MADGVTISSTATFNVLSDEVTLGAQTGHKQLIGLLDGTDGGTNRASVDSSGRLATAAYLLPATTGGTTVGKLIAAATTNATSVKGSAGHLYWVYVYNASGSVQYVKFYNKATAPTVGTDTPVLTLPIPPGSAATFSLPQGAAFATGIGFGTTTDVADNGSTAVAANSLVINYAYA